MNKEHQNISHVENQFNFEAGSINTVIKGGTFNAPVYTTPQQDDKNNKAQRPPTPPEAFKQSVEQLVNDKIIVQKKDFGILYKLDQEMCLLGLATYEDYVQRVNELVSLPEDIRPTAGSIKSVNLGKNNYPNWNLKDLAIGVSSHVKAVANGYIREMENRGYPYPFEQTHC